MSVLGLDIGTTGCKAASFTQQGDLIAIAYREYARLSLPTGHAQLDSRAVLDDLWAVICQLAPQTTKDPGEALFRHFPWRRP